MDNHFLPLDHDAPPQRGRVVHCRIEPFDIYIGRSMNRYPIDRYPELRATGWGNPFRPAPGDPDAGNAIARYRAWLLQQPQLLARLPELRGRTLGCWCAPLGGLDGDLEGRICHGQVLAALADEVGASDSVVGAQDARDRSAATDSGDEQRRCR